MKESVEHYYTKNPKSEKIYYGIKKKVLGHTVKFKTASGTYSPQNIDKGSIIHLKHAKIKETDKVLDLGCGYGTVGILVAKMYPKTKVYMTEINQRAVDCAKENINTNDVKAKVTQGDGFENLKNEKFDVVLFNPPINAGLKVCYRLIAESFEHLKLNGTLQVVIRPREAKKRILKKMESIFGNVELIGKEDIYEVYLSKKETKNPKSEYDKTMAFSRVIIPRFLFVFLLHFFLLL